MREMTWIDLQNTVQLTQSDLGHIVWLPKEQKKKKVTTNTISVNQPESICISQIVIKEGTKGLTLNNVVHLIC